MITLYGELRRRKRLAVDAKKKELQAAKVTGAELKQQLQDHETSLNAANSAGKGRKRTHLPMDSSFWTLSQRQVCDRFGIGTRCLG